MLTVLEDAKEIGKAERALIRAFKDYGAKRVTTNVGYPGGSIQATVLWISRLGLWLSADAGEENRYWNAFGTEDPKSTVSICCEINLPRSGVNRRVGGVLAKDEAGSVFLLHRGKIGGGREGIGSTLFWKNFNRQTKLIVDGDRHTEMAVIGKMSSPRLVPQIHFFIEEIKRIKSEGSGPSNGVKEAPEFGIKEFTDEFHGRKRFKNNSTTDSVVDHGLIVNRLAAALKDRDYQVGKDQFRDLYVYRGDKATSLFEIKSELTTTNVYGGVGQLLFHRVSMRPVPSLFLVVPAPLSPELRSKLEVLGIKVLSFTWGEDDEPVFAEIDKTRF